MKNYIVLSFLIVLFCLVSSCQKKSSSTTNSTTATTSIASPSVNTAISIGGSFPGWTTGACPSNPTLTAINATSTVELAFGGGSVSASGTYTFTSGIPGPGQARLKILDPPGQPSGFQWFSASGSQTVSMTFTPPNYLVAIFNNINCTQSTTSTPIVVASGSMVCM